jgi:hypothetical protein
LPRYAACSYQSFSDYFSAMADLFCITGNAGMIGEGGAAGAAP